MLHVIVIAPISGNHSKAPSHCGAFKARGHALIPSVGTSSGYFANFDRDKVNMIMK